jgi:hypothetical protein
MPNSFFLVATISGASHEGRKGHKGFHKGLSNEFFFGERNYGASHEVHQGHKGLPNTFFCWLQVLRIALVK